jgi:hemoglobin
MPCPFGSSSDYATQSSKRILSLAPTPKLSIYEKLGGREAVREAVDIFYVKVMLDKRVNGFFKNVNLPKQRAKQMMFMVMAFGGPSEYTGRSLYDAHHGLNLTEEHFTAIAECFTATMQEMGVQQQLVDEGLAVLAGVKDQVIGH